MRVCDRCKSVAPAQKISVRMDDVTSGPKVLIEEDFDLCANCINWLKSQVHRVFDWGEKPSK